jgi:small subunit ribosomal protein S20
MRDMPNIKSAKKRVKVISVKTLQNKMFKSNLKTTVKKFYAAVESGNKEEATAAYKAAVKKVDQAAARNIIHKNNAAHKKSQFTLLLNKMH